MGKRLGVGRVNFLSPVPNTLVALHPPAHPLQENYCFVQKATPSLLCIGEVSLSLFLFLSKLRDFYIALLFSFDCVRLNNIQNKLRFAFSKLRLVILCACIQNCSRKPLPWRRANEELFFPNYFWWMRFLYAFI